MTLIAPVLHAGFFVLVALAVVAACQWIFRKSVALGVIVYLGAAVRLVTGVGFFALSYWNASLLRSLHTGDGFWVVALDARVYYALAAQIANGGQFSVSDGGPSPFFVAMLGLWLRASGATLVSVVFFNLACFVATAVVLVKGLDHGSEWSRSAAVLVLSSFAFSPILLLTSSQALKDPLFALLIVLACVGSLRSFDLMRRSSPGVGRALVGWLLAVCLAFYGIAGTRTYYVIFLWIAYAGALLASVWVCPAVARVRHGASGLAVLAVLWVAFMVGGGAYYEDYRALIEASTGVRLPSVAGVLGTSPPAFRPSLDADLTVLGTTVLSLREGFVKSGGATNLVDNEAGATAKGVLHVVREVGVGLSAMFVPVSILKGLSVVTFDGGRGFLSVTDIDTLFLDLTVLVGCVLVYRNRYLIAHDSAGIVFLVMLVLISGTLLAYVVTNFGTLFRLRLLTVVPIWVVPLALDRRPSTDVRPLGRQC